MLKTEKRAYYTSKENKTGEILLLKQLPTNIAWERVL